ncbi:hypothetical protein PR202_gn00078 [Eleusine coracana subsp. coracana]|uniref:Uncharacterized protein n=1 Tax=Eleusine coracana subsp. coracana TaxID=191504 RepID=A0AAV5F9Q8_ELECO|nr:hypothetical protein PR202_gb20049 [Eleusine coracana subsp. coracana]GJN40779.1 hypothetical protein PR202_gn00078 [Eleusine coracana subsp. coracana]
MEAGEAAGALLFLLAAAAAVAAAVATGAINFTYLVAGTAKRLAFPSLLSQSQQPLCLLASCLYRVRFLSVCQVGSGESPSWRDAWTRVRSRAVAPALQAAVWACMVMSVMLVVEATYHFAVSLGVKLLGWKPERRFKWEPLSATAGDEEEGMGDASAYPMVMVQIPMYNELQVYKLSIGAACELKWPKERLIVQVLDDSTDPIIKNFTVNDRASILTRVQKTFLDYHFKVEQEAGSATFSFFSFNGT